jgi:DNA-binding SARP family transcriptional activator
MRFAILGPVRVSTRDRDLAITAPGLRILLAMLLLEADQVVSTDRLGDAIWPVKAPRDVRNQVQQHVVRLRRLLAEAGIERGLIVTESGGYRIALDPERLDLHEFHRLVAAARTATREDRLDEAGTAYRGALALWRGPALANLDCPAVRQAAATLDDERVQVAEECIEVELGLGRASELLAELDQLTRQHPYRERLHGLQMLALYRAGRYADALAAYRRVDRLLRDELGVGPGRELRDLHRSILDRDPGLHRRQPGQAAPAPRELPADVAGFTGREQILAELDGLWPGGQPAAAAVNSVIAGPAGAGKTALAVHWAHRMADRFPDGQLFIDLHGFTMAAAPVGPGDALERMLRSLGVPGERIPDELDDRARLWRSTLAGRRVLIVLDNAATEAQVGPLLPGSAGCLALVTSRRTLSSLDLAHRVSLDMLPPPDASALFARLVGEERLASQPREHVSGVLELCGRLPLAIRIAAARLRLHPVWSVVDLLERLRDKKERLGELAEHSGGVATALDMSYRQLTEPQRLAYRRLGLNPGPDADPYLAAALAGTSLAEARRCLDQLLDAHLLQEPATGRYVFHDLVRIHAAGIAAERETEVERDAALARLRDYYRHTASIAMDAVYPYERSRRPRVPPAGVPAPDLSDPRRATGWLDAELPGLLATAHHAAGRDHPAHIWDLSATVDRHLRTRGRYREAEDLHRLALTAARAAHDPGNELAALICLGHVHALRGRHEQGIEHYERARELARTIGDRIGELQALTGLGKICRIEVRYEEALVYLGQAREIAQSTGEPLDEVEALIGLGNTYRQQGRYEPALANLGRALEIARSAGIRTGMLSALTGLGAIYGQQGHDERALGHFEQAWQIARAAGNRTVELIALLGLGRCYLRQGRHDQAADCYPQALELARSSGHHTGELDALIGLGHVHRLQERYELAAGFYEQGLTSAREIGSRNWQFEALQGLGRLHHANRCPDAALAHHQRALDIVNDSRQPADLARVHDGLAHAYDALHQYDQARFHWQAALDILAGLHSDHTEDPEANAPAIRAQLARLDKQGVQLPSEAGT